MAAFLSANGYFGLINEVTRGTTPGTGTVQWIPVIEPTITPNLTWLNDHSLRGSPVENYDQVPATRSDDTEFKSYLYADTIPAVIRALLGGTDTVTGVTSYTHAIKLLNSASTGSQPVSQSLCVFDGANYFQSAGGQADSATITFGASAAAELTAKYIGNPYTNYTTAQAPFTTLSVSTESLIPAWDTAVTIASTPYTWIEDGEITIARKTAPIFTLGAQGPFQNFAGPVEVSGKFTAVINSNADAWTAGATPSALSRGQEAMTIVLTNPNNQHGAVNDSLTFTMSNAQFEHSKRMLSKSYTSVEVRFVAVADTTDASSGYSPLAFTAINGVSAAY
ncbi:MAG: hypothetical protein KGH65_04945 [Candidatus Micrarchaeota archaeon]|nr:hypothetical protein [Candidatus Micrarchaeota archaeon]